MRAWLCEVKCECEKAREKKCRENNRGIPS